MKKFLTGLLLAVAAFVAPSASAYTVKQILDDCEYMVANFNCMANIAEVYGGELVQSQGIHLSQAGKNQIKFSGFMGKLDFVFTLVDENGNPTEDGNELKILSSTVACGGELFGSSKWYIYPCQITRQYDWYMGYILKQVSDPSYNFYIEILKDDNGKLYMKGEQPIRLYTADSATNFLSGMTSTSQLHTGLYFWDTYFYPMECNGVATDRFVDYDYTPHKATPSGNIDIFEVSSVNRQYGVNVTFDKAKGTFSIMNFGNNGYGINPQQTTFVVGGTIDEDNKMLIFNKNQFAKWAYCLAGTNYIGDYGEYNEYQIERFSLDKDYEVRDELFGYYTEEHGLHHNDATHSWVTNKGKRKTYEDELRITVEPYTYYRNAFNYYVLNFLGGYHDTEIDASIDVTLDVDLTLTKSEYHPELGIWLEGSVKTNKNSMYVDHYELMVVEGRWDHIEQEGFLPCAENGHEQAKVFHVNLPVQTRAIDTDDKSHLNFGFSKVVKPQDFGFTPSDKGCTAFIRAHYKEETGLTPTFHSMQYLEVGKPTSIEGVDDDIITSDAPAEYYTLQGVRVDAPEKGQVYIVRRGTAVSKVRY